MHYGAGMVEFKSRQTLRGGLWIEVHRSGVLIGHIRMSIDRATFRYFRGSCNELAPSYEDRDLDRLKRRVRKEP
jgi:hypothetical protein